MSRTFIYFFGEVENIKEKEMGVANPERLPIDIYVDPDMVIAANDCINNDGEIDGCCIYLSSGSSFWVTENSRVVLNRCGIIIDGK